MTDPKKKYTVFPGQIVITTVPALITTVLGSCVAVCLWDKQTLTSGMTHFLLPGTPMDSPDNANRGITSTRLLVRSMINRKIDLTGVEAKVFGGCNSLYRNNDIYKIGERNVAVAFEVLKEYDIPVKAHHTGGAYGRKIVFNTVTGKVRMRLLVKSAADVNEEINKGFGY
jgi:chemotaxis protein CheD